MVNNIKMNFVTNPTSVFKDPQSSVSRTLTLRSHRGSLIHYPARGHSFARSWRASSSLINDVSFPAVGSGLVYIGKLEFWIWRPAGSTRPSYSLHIFQSPLSSGNTALICCASCFAFGHGHTLRHGFAWNPPAGHFDVDEERGGG